MLYSVNNGEKYVLAENFDTKVVNLSVYGPEPLFGFKSMVGIGKAETDPDNELEFVKKHFCEEYDAIAPAEKIFQLFNDHRSTPSFSEVLPVSVEYVCLALHEGIQVYKDKDCNCLYEGIEAERNPECSGYVGGYIKLKEINMWGGYLRRCAKLQSGETDFFTCESDRAFAVYRHSAQVENMLTGVWDIKKKVRVGDYAFRGWKSLNEDESTDPKDVAFKIAENVDNKRYLLLASGDVLVIKNKEGVKAYYKIFSSMYSVPNFFDESYPEEK